MPRKGIQLERWAEENMRGDPTVNSGATFEDADMKVDGVGGRVYEFKSSEENHGLSIDRVAILRLLQRAIKLNRQPVFIYQNADHLRFAMTPLKIVASAVGRWDDVNYQSETVMAVKHAFSHCPSIKAKGNNVRVSAESLASGIAHNGLMMYVTKNGIQWVIMEADAWLEIAGDRKIKEKKNDE